MTREDLQSENSKLKEENNELKEQVRLLRSAVFGKKSEKLTDVLQNLLFNEAETHANKEPEDAPADEHIDVPSHKRKKAGRKPLSKDLPRVEILHVLEGDEKICACGAELVEFGEDVSERLNYIPPRIEVEKHSIC